MLFTRQFSSLVVFAVMGLAGVHASPVAQPHDLVERTNPPAPGGGCNVGEAQCCKTTYQSGSPTVKILAELLGIVIPVDGLLVGAQCSPIGNILNLLDGSETCNSQAVCCSNNNYNGVINIGCSPISV